MPAKKSKEVKSKEEKKDVVHISKRTDIITRRVKLVGLTPIMFDRYPGLQKRIIEFAENAAFNHVAKAL